MIEQLTILERAVAKERPRLGRRGVYTPSKTSAYEAMIRAAYRRNCKTIFHEGVHLQVAFCRAVPKSWSIGQRRDALNGEIECTVKPDIDNMVKAIMDGLNGAAWDDDKQVISLVVTKEYAEQDSIRITIYDKEAW